MLDVSKVAIRFGLCDPSKFSDCDECYKRGEKEFCYSDDGRKYDVNQDGIINLIDVVSVANYWGEECD